MVLYDISPKGGKAMRVEKIGTATLYLADSSEVAPTLANIDAIVTDPPYGMDWDTDSTRFSGGLSGDARYRGQGKADWEEIAGDASPFHPAPWLQYPKVILWEPTITRQGFRRNLACLDQAR